MQGRGGDCAGAEGVVMKEAAATNKSLLALGNVVNALVCCVLCVVV